MADLANLKTLFAAKGFETVDPPILQSAQAFLDYSGEDIRRRLFLTQGADGKDYCLRPDFTIPVARIYLEKGEGAVAYSYAGPVFRQRPDGSAEFLQAGVEMIGHDKAAEAESQLLAFALEAVKLYGLNTPDLRLGDSAVLKSVLQALNVPEGMARRIRRAMGKGKEALEKAMEPQTISSSNQGLVAAMAGKTKAESEAMVGEVLALAGIAEIGGRPVAHIAERLREQAELAQGLSAEARDALNAYFAISGSLPEAITALETLSKARGLELNGRLDAFRQRADLMVSAGIDVSQVQFSTRFGRRMDYYTGMVFEIYDPQDVAKGHVVGGGRYDGLLTALGAKTPVPAVGCSIWLERLKGVEA